jgi:hypothetical protein
MLSGNFVIKYCHYIYGVMYGKKISTNSKIKIHSLNNKIYLQEKINNILHTMIKMPKH